MGKNSKWSCLRFSLYRALLLSLLVILVMSGGLQAATDSSTDSSIYTLKDTQYYRVVHEYFVENEGEKNATDITIKIQFINPALTRQMPYSTLLASYYEPKPNKIFTDEKGNQTGKYKIAQLKPGEKRIIRVYHDYRISLADYKIDREKVGTYQLQPEALALYLNASPGIECNHPLIHAKAEEIVGTETNPFLKAKKIFTFVNQHMTYTDPNKENVETNKGALWALETGKGVCEDYAKLMVALLRASGVPARTITGWNGEIELGKKHMINNGSPLPGHMWVEYYLPDYGWIPADPTFTSRKMDYSRLTGIKQPSFAETSEMRGHAVSYSFRGKVNITCALTIKKLDPENYFPLPLDYTPAPLLYLEDIPIIFDVEPLIENGHTLVPLREVFKVMGANVVWDNASKKITVSTSDERSVELQVGSNVAVVNGEQVLLDIPVSIKLNKTMIPLRLVSEMMDCEVNWDGNTRIINLRFKK
ncbi:MAG TPA: transglutaminase domain-containing protein [Peptococcaceae bacterium]|nr:transglutaminase domain-containing protein [Peptococcaceae bacterium]